MDSMDEDTQSVEIMLSQVMLLVHLQVFGEKKYPDQ